LASQLEILAFLFFHLSEKGKRNLFKAKIEGVTQLSSLMASFKKNFMYVFFLVEEPICTFGEAVS